MCCQRVSDFSDSPSSGLMTLFVPTIHVFLEFNSYDKNIDNIFTISVSSLIQKMGNSTVRNYNLKGCLSDNSKHYF